MCYSKFKNVFSCVTLSITFAACGITPPTNNTTNAPDTSVCVEPSCETTEDETDNTPTVITDWSGDLSIDMDSDSELLTNIQTISGNLQIGPSENMSLPALQSISGSLNISLNDAILTLSAPNLKTIGQNLALNLNNRLKQIDLPALQSIGMELRIAQNKKLKTINIGALTSTNLSCSISQNSALESVDLTTLASVGLNFEMIDNTVFPTCEAQSIADNLTTLGGTITISGNDNVASCTEN